MTTPRSLQLFTGALAMLALQACTYVQTIAPFEFTVRVTDLSDGKPVSGAEVFPRLDSGTPNRPGIELGPIKTDDLGLARVRFPGKEVKVSSFDSYFVGGYDTWPWIHVTHPDYEYSGFSLPGDTEKKVAEKGEVLFRLRKKESPGEPSKPPTGPAPNHGSP